MSGEPTQSGLTSDNSRTIARSAAWSGIETMFGMVVVFATSVAVADVMGKDAAGQARLGSYQYIVGLTTITFTLGSFGLPATTLKYMAEYLNNGKPEIARATYLSTLKIQSYLALAAAAIGFALVGWLGSHSYFTAAALLIAAIVPRLIASVPSQANNAAETVRRNTLPSMAGATVTALLTAVSLLRGWDFVGLSAAVLAGVCLECGLKLRSVERWLGKVPRGTVPPDLRRRMLAYSGQGLALLLLNLAVWDRYSDIIILGLLNHDTRQILFFSLPFSLAERVLMIPTLFGGALYFTMTAQYGRGEGRLKEMTVDGGRYALLIALPLLLGLACLSEPIVLLVYPKYGAMIPTLTAVALLAIPKALIFAPTSFLQTTERQGFLITWGCICGAIDIGLDILLVGRHGSFGAAIANGIAQTLAALGIWLYVWKADRLDLKLVDCGRIVVSGAIMAMGVIAVNRLVHGTRGLCASVATGAVLWMVALRITAALKRQDVSRFLSAGRQLPAGVRPYWKSLIAWLAPSVTMD